MKNMKMKKRMMTVAIAVSVLSGLLAAQEPKAVPKDSVRVSISGCTRGLIFTAGPRSERQPRPSDIPDGMHLRMSGPKKMLSDIKAHEGSTIEITGLMKKGQFNEGVGIGGGVRVSPGPPQAGGSLSPTFNQIVIDVEGWRPLTGDCPSR